MVFQMPVVMVLVSAGLIALLVLHATWSRRAWRRAVLVGYLASVVRRGYPLAPSVRALATEAAGGRMLQLEALAAHLEEGMPLADAIDLTGNLLPPDETDLIRAGETSGNLAVTLETLGAQRRQSGAARAVVLGVAAYPAMMLAVLGPVIVLYFTLIVPKFRAIAESFGTVMPDAFDTVLLMFRLMVVVLLAGAGTLAMLVFPPKRYRGIRGGVTDPLRWVLPWTRRYDRSEGIGRFSRFLSAQLRSGVSMREALARACEVPAAGWVTKRLARVRDGVEQGAPLSEAVRAARLFPARVLHLLGMGETSGDLPAVLDEIAVDAHDRCGRVLAWTSAVILPASVLMVGLAVGVLCVTVFRALVGIMEML